jgi:hypothetical protein
MIINIKRQQNEKQLEELKYTVILKKSHLGGIGYDWNLKGESNDESLEDFHLFCISIVKDLFEKNFKVNEDIEDKSYDFDEDYVDTESTLEDLDYLWGIIADKKLKSI